MGDPLNLVGNVLGSLGLNSAQIQEAPAQDGDDQTLDEDNSGDDLVSTLEEENPDDLDEWRDILN